MDVTKEYLVNEPHKRIRVIIRTDTYTRSMDHLNMLAGMQKEDFPDVSYQEAIIYGGRHYKRTMGIEGYIPLDSTIPDSYGKVTEVENTL